VPLGVVRKFASVPWHAVALSGPFDAKELCTVNVALFVTAGPHGPLTTTSTA